MVFEALLAAGLTARDGAALPRQLALDADHRADDPALDPRLDPRAARARRDAEPDDARRPGALGRHPRRPGDRHDREHRAAPAPRQAARRRDPRRRRRDRRAGVRLDAVHLHRLRADVLPVRRRPLPVRAAGRGGGLRHGRVVHPVADAGADAGDAADARLARPGRAGGGRAAEPAAARLPRLRPRVRARARRLHARCSPRCSPSAACFGIAFLAFCLLSCGLYPVLGRDFFPSVDAGQIRLHLRAADRHADRGDGAHRRRGRGGDPPARFPRTSSRPSSTTSACRTAASTSRTATPARSARSTARSCCR